MSKNNSGKKIKLTKDFSYPDPNDPDLLIKIFKKREFFYHKVQLHDFPWVGQQKDV